MNLEVMVRTLGLSLALTILFEAAFAMLTGRRSRRDMLVLAAVNVATNPPVVLIYHFARRLLGHGWLLIALLEFAVVFVEFVLYKGYGGSFKRPLLFAVAVNAFSFGLGTLINRLI